MLECKVGPRFTKRGRMPPRWTRRGGGLPRRHCHSGSWPTAGTAASPVSRNGVADGWPRHRFCGDGGARRSRQAAPTDVDQRRRQTLAVAEVHRLESRKRRSGGGGVGEERICAHRRRHLELGTPSSLPRRRRSVEHFGRPVEVQALLIREPSIVIFFLRCVV